MTNLQNIVEKAQFLAKVALFSEIAQSSEALEKLANIMTRKSFNAGEMIIEQGQPGQEFFVLISGEVSVYKRTPDGDKYKVAVLSANNFSSFGEGGLMEGEERSASILSESSTECLVLGRVDFSKFCLDYPQYALPIIKRIALALMARLNQTSHDLLLLHAALMSEIRST